MTSEPRETERTDPPRDAAKRADENARDLASLLGASVEIEAVLGEKRVPLGDISNAEIGADLLLLSRDRSIRLLAAGVEIGEGTAVEVEGRVALRVDRLRPVEEYVAELGGILRDLVEERDARDDASEFTDEERLSPE